LRGYGYGEYGEVDGSRCNKPCTGDQERISVV